LRSCLHCPGFSADYKQTDAGRKRGGPLRICLKEADNAVCSPESIEGTAVHGAGRQAGPRMFVSVRYVYRHVLSVLITAVPAMRPVLRAVPRPAWQYV